MDGGGKVTYYIKADGLLRDAEKIYRHEKFHELVRGNEELMNKLMEAMEQEYSKQEIERLVMRYVEAYGSIYGEITEDMTEKKRKALIREYMVEVFADAYADIQRGKYSIQNAKTILKSQTDAVQRAEQNKKATGQKTAPPEQRYSLQPENEELLALIKRVKNNEAKDNEYCYLGIVSDVAASEIKKIIGVDVSGWRIKIEARQIKHILNDHGQNGATDRSMANDSDIAKIEFILNNFDSVIYGGKTLAYSSFVNGRNRTADTILYEKEIGAKSQYVVQAVPITKAKTLFVVSSFIGEKGYKKKTQQLTDAKSHSATSENGSAEVSTIMISQNDRDVKQNYSVSEEMDANGNSLSEMQQEYFKNSAVRDISGKLKVVYHGTDAEFTVFDFMKAGSKVGRAEGFGFYFTDNPKTAAHYGSLKKYYLNITKPLDGQKKTMSRSEFRKIVSGLLAFDLQEQAEEGLTWQDSFLSNYVYTYEMSKATAIRQVAEMMFDANDSDVEMIYELANADGRSYTPETIKPLYDVVTRETGHDGIRTIWEDDKTRERSEIYVAFNSEQAKLTDNKNPTKKCGHSFFRGRGHGGAGSAVAGHGGRGRTVVGGSGRG